MATEANIQESVFLKKGEMEENALTSETFEEKVTELPVKQVEISSLVAETVNTPLETGKTTAESGIFFQALSVTMVIADEHSNTPESCKAAKPTEPEEKTIEKAIQSEEDIKETTEDHATIVPDFKKQYLNETPRELIKEETDDKSVDAQEESGQGEIGSKHIEEPKYGENVKEIEQDEETKTDVETEKTEQNGLVQAITSDACITTQTIPQGETTEHEEKEQDVNVLEKDQDEDAITRAQEVTVEGVLQEKSHQNEDNEYEVVKAKGSVEEDADVCISTQTTFAEKSIKNEEPEVCEEKALSTIEKDQGDSDGVTSSQESPCVDVQETTTFKEQDLNEKPREFIKEETEDKSLDAQETSHECEKEAKEDIDKNPEESVKIIEKEEETEEIKPGVEIEEKKEQNELLPEITPDVCITTHIDAQVEKTEHEKEDTQNDDGLKETSDSFSIKEVCEEIRAEKIEYETVTKDENEDEEKKKEVNVTFEKDLLEKNHHNEDDEREVAAAEETIEKDIENETERKDEEQEKEQEIYVSEKVQSGQDDVTSSENASNEQEQHTEEIKPSVETTEEKDVCISTQIESQEKATTNEEYANEKNDQKADNPIVNEVCEENDLKKTEAEEEIKLSDSSVVTTESVDEDDEKTKASDETKETTEPQGVLNDITTDVCSSTQTENIENTTSNEEKPESPLVEVVNETTKSQIAESEEGSTTLNEKEALDKEEKLEKEDDIKTSEIQGGGDDVASSQNVSNEDIKQTIDQHETSVAYVEEGHGVIAMSKEIIIEEAEDKSIDAEELGEPNEHNTEAHPSQNPEDEIKKEDKDFSHESVEDKNDDSTKEEKCTLEQEPVEEHTDQDEVSKEKVTHLHATEDVEPKEEIIPSTSLETSTDYPSNSEKEKAESENLPTEDLETISEEQIPELVPKSEEPPVLKKTETHIDEERISSAEKTEVQGGGDDVTSLQNACDEGIQETIIGHHDTTVTSVDEGQNVSVTPKEILTENAEDKSFVSEEMPLELGQPNEQNVDEALSSLSKTITENPEEQIKKEDKDLSYESVEDNYDDTTKEEKCTLEQEPVKEHSGSDEVSKEMVTDSNETTEVEPQEDITPSTSLEPSTEDTSNSQKEKTESESLPLEDLETVSQVQQTELVHKSEEPILEEKCIVSETETRLDEEKETATEEISSDEKTQETVKEVCEETTSEIAEHEEGSKLSDSSNMTINEKEITFKDDNEEKAQEATESQGEENLTSSQIEVSEEKEDLKEKNSHNEGDFSKSAENVDEDTEEIKSSVESIENTEHVTAINVCSSTQIEAHEEAIENEEKEDEKAIEYDEYETVSREFNLEKKQEDVEETKIGENATTNEEKDVCISTQNESQEETSKNEENAIERDGDEKEKSDNAIVKEVCEENDLTIESEGRQLSDSSDIKTTEGVDEATEETKSSDETKENTENVTANEENIDVETIKNDDAQTEKPESPSVEVVCETTRSEGAESEEGIKQSDSFSTTLNENETLSKEGKLEKEDEIKTSEVEGGEVEVTSSQNPSIDQHNTNAAHVNEQQDVSALPEEILIEEANDKSIDAEEMSLELAQPSEHSEDEIKKEDKDLSHESVEGTNDNNAKEEKCTLEHELVKEITTEVEPQEEVTPSTSLETSTEDTSNSVKEKTESENLPTEDLETVSEVQIPELVPKEEETMLKEECFISEKETHLDEEKGTITEEISSDEKTQQTTEIKQETIKEVSEETSSEKVESEERQLSDITDIKTREEVNEDTEETKSSEETKENTEQQGVLNVNTTDVSSSTQTQNVEKSTRSEKYNDEETIEHDEKPEIPLVEDICEETKSEIVESEEGVKLEKKDGINTSEVQGSGDEVTSLKNAPNDDIKETTIGQHDTTVACVEEEQDVSAMPKEILREKAEDKAVDAEEILLEFAQPKEQNVETTIRETQEDEIKKEDRGLSHESMEYTNDDAAKEETCTLENEPLEEHSGQDEVSKEKVIDLNETTEVEPEEDITPSISLETSTKDTSNSEEEKAEVKDSPVEDVETVSEVQIAELVPKSEESVLKEECVSSETETHLDEEKETLTEEISTDEKTEQTTDIKKETDKEVCEEATSEKTDVEEGSKLSDDSNMKINEKEITTFKDDDQEVNTSTESQGEENIKSSRTEVSEEKEDLQEKNNHNEGDFIKSGEGVDEDTEEIKASVETKEDTEHVIANNVCSSTQIEPNEETIEKNGEKAIENNEDETLSREVKLEDVCSSAQTEAKEETIESKETNEEAIDNDDGKMKPENHEKEQEPEVSEVQGGGDDFVSSQNTAEEDTKETAIGQQATTTGHFEEGLGVSAITKEITVDAQEASEQCENEAKDKIQQEPEESVNKPVNSGSETIEGSIKEEQADAENNKEIEFEPEATEPKDEAVLTENVSKELGETNEQNVEETEACLTETISEKTEDKITKDEELTHDSIEHINEDVTKEEKSFPDVITKDIEISKLEHNPVEEQIDIQDEPTAAESQEDITPYSSMATSAEDTLNSDKAKGVSETLPSEDLESVSEVHIAEVTPESEDSKMKEECLVSKTETFADEENKTVTKEISSDENLETHESTEKPDNSYSTTKENVTQSEESGEINSVYENRDIKEQENQLNSTEDCSEMEKDAILTKEIEQVPLEIEKEKVVSDFQEQIVEEDSYSPNLEEKLAQDHKEIVHEIPIPAENPDVTEVTVDGHIGHDGLQVKEDETVKSVDLSTDRDVKIPKVVADSEDAKVKEECTVVETTDENSVEEQDTKTNEISSAPDKEDENAIEEKALPKENLEIHGDPIPTSEPVIEEDQVTIETKPQPEQSDITSENITNDKTLESKLEHTSVKDLEDGKEQIKENVTLAPENETKSTENLNETVKNIILTDEVAALETEKEKEKIETEEHVAEDDRCATELDSLSTPDQKELANEIEDSKPIPVGNTEVAEVKAESQIEAENTQAAEDLSCLSKESKVEMHEDTEQTITVIGEVKDAGVDEASKDKIFPVLEDSKASELQVNLPKTESTDTPSNDQGLINDEAKVDELTSCTDVSQIERSSSKPNEFLKTKDSAEDTDDVKFMADKLDVKDEKITGIKESDEDDKTVASELKTLEDTVTDKEKETLNEPQADDTEKITCDSTLSSKEQDSKIATEVAEVVPECREPSAILTDNLPEASPEMLLAKHEGKITEERKVLPSVEKEVIDVQKHEKDLDHQTEVRITECSDIAPHHIDTKEATWEFVNQENQSEQTKEADESTENVIPVEDVKTSTRELEVASVDPEVPSIIAATADKALVKDDEHLESTCDESKPIEEGSGIKQEPLELDASGTLGTAAKEELKISQKYVPDDLIKVNQTHPEIQNYELPACTTDKQSPNEPHPKESTESKIMTEKIDSPHEQGELVTKSLNPEAENLKDNTTGSVDQKEKSESAEPAKEKSEVAGNLIGERDFTLVKDQQMEKEETGVKTDEEDEEEEDHEDNEKMGSGSDAPVMVEASKDMEVKAHKKHHNILSGVGSKVKHSIAKVKKAITGKSPPPKSSSPKAKNQVTG